MAPRVGFEPTANRLQLPPNFFEDWTISFPNPCESGIGRFPRLSVGVLPCGIVSAPSSILNRGLAQDCLKPFGN